MTVSIFYINKQNNNYWIASLNIEETFNSPEDFKQNFATSEIKIGELTKNAIDVAYERLLENGWGQE